MINPLNFVLDIIIEINFFKYLNIHNYHKILIEFLTFFLVIHLFKNAISSRQAILNPCLFSIAETKSLVL